MGHSCRCGTGVSWFNYKEEVALLLVCLLQQDYVPLPVKGKPAHTILQWVLGGLGLEQKQGGLGL